MSKTSPSFHDFQRAADVLAGSERAAAVSSVIEELVPSTLGFSPHDRGPGGEVHSELEWGDSAGIDEVDQSLSACPVSNLLYDPGQTTSMKLATLVQYMRVLKRTEPQSRRVRRLTNEAAELERLPLPGIGRLRGTEEFVAASTICREMQSARRTAGTGQRAALPSDNRQVEEVVRALLEGQESDGSHNTCKTLVNVVKRAIFGSSGSPDHVLLQRVVENVRFLNHEIPLYERIAFDCTRLVLQSRTADFLADTSVSTAVSAGASDASAGRSEPKYRRRGSPPRKSHSPHKRDLAGETAREVRKIPTFQRVAQERNSSELPTRFVDHTRRSIGTAMDLRPPSPDLVILSNQGPKTISRYLRESPATRYSVDSHPDAMRNAGQASEVVMGGAQNSAPSPTPQDVASMSWKLDELMKIRKTCDDLTEERDKAVSLYQEAVSARRQSHKDCIRAQEEYSTIQAFIPVILESVQDITSVVKTADAEARAQWRQFDNVDKISKQMLAGIERVFDEVKHIASERLQLRNDLYITGQKLRKYRSKLDLAREESARSAERLAFADQRMQQAVEEEARARLNLERCQKAWQEDKEIHARKAQEESESHNREVRTLKAETKVTIETIIADHEALVKDMKETHAAFRKETQSQHDESMARLEERRSKQLADAEARRAKQVSDLETKRVREVELAESKRSTEVASLEEQLSREVADHKSSVEEWQVRYEQEIASWSQKYSHTVAEMEAQRSKEVSELKNKLEEDRREAAARRVREVRELETRLDNEKMEHNSTVKALKAKHSAAMSALEKDKSREVQVTEEAWTREVLELKTQWSRQVAQIQEENAEERESVRVEHQRRVQYVEKEKCFGLICNQKHESMQRRVKAIEKERDQLFSQLQAAQDASTQALNESAENSEKKLHALQEELDKKTTALGSCNAEELRFQDQLIEARAELHEKSKAISALQVSCDEFQAALGAAKHDLQASNKELETLKTQLAQTCRDREQTCRDHEKFLAELKQEYSEEISQREEILHQTRDELVRCQHLLEEARDTSPSIQQASQGYAETQDPMLGGLLAQEVDDKASATADEASATPQHSQRATGILGDSDKSTAQRNELVVGSDRTKESEQAFACNLGAASEEILSPISASASSATVFPSGTVPKRRETGSSKKCFKCDDFEIKLQRASQQLNKTKALLHKAQLAAEDSDKARRAAELLVDEHKYAVTLAQQRLEVAQHTAQDAVDAQDRMQKQLDSATGMNYRDVQDAEKEAMMSKEVMRRKNAECAELKNQIRNLESELKLLTEDRAHFTTRHAAERRDYQNKYRAAEDGRRTLELQNEELQDELRHCRANNAELKHSLISKRWAHHSQAEERRRMQEQEFLTHMQESLESESTARKRAESQVVQLINLNKDKKRPSHLFKEPLLREKLLLRDSRRSWGRIPPSSDMPSPPHGGVTGLAGSGDRESRPRKIAAHVRPTSAPGSRSKTPQENEEEALHDANSSLQDRMRQRQSYEQESADASRSTPKLDPHMTSGNLLPIEVSSSRSAAALGDRFDSTWSVGRRRFAASLPTTPENMERRDLPTRALGSVPRASSRTSGAMASYNDTTVQAVMGVGPAAKATSQNEIDAVSPYRRSTLGQTPSQPTRLAATKEASGGRVAQLDEDSGSESD